MHVLKENKKKKKTKQINKVRYKKSEKIK